MNNDPYHGNVALTHCGPFRFQSLRRFRCIMTQRCCLRWKGNWFQGNRSCSGSMIMLYKAYPLYTRSFSLVQLSVSHKNLALIDLLMKLLSVSKIISKQPKVFRSFQEWISEWISQEYFDVISCSVLGRFFFQWSPWSVHIIHTFSCQCRKAIPQWFLLIFHNVLSDHDFPHLSWCFPYFLNCWNLLYFNDFPTFWDCLLFFSRQKFFIWVCCKKSQDDQWLDKCDGGRCCWN